MSEKSIAEQKEERKVFYVEVPYEPTEDQLLLLGAKLLGADVSQVCDSIAADRDAFDLNQWRLRAPTEIQLNQLSGFADTQQVYRRNIETLTALRKIKPTQSNEESATKLFEAVDKQLLTFVNALTIFGAEEVASLPKSDTESTA